MSKLMHFIAVLGVVGLSSQVALATGLAVAVVDYPEQVLEQSPVVVTARIDTSSREPIALVPVGNDSNRVVFEVSRDGGDYVEVNPAGWGTLGRVRPVTLTNDSPWYVSFDLRPALRSPATYAIRLAVFGNGKCHEQSETSCFDGVVRSYDVVIVVRPVTRPVDLAAWKFIESEEFSELTGGLDSIDVKLWNGSRILQKRYPQSHFTYVSTYYGSKEYDWLLANQPSHSLTKYTRLRRVMAAQQEALTTALERGSQGIDFCDSDQLLDESPLTSVMAAVAEQHRRVMLQQFAIRAGDQ